MKRLRPKSARKALITSKTFSADVFSGNNNETNNTNDDINDKNRSENTDITKANENIEQIENPKNASQKQKSKELFLLSADWRQVYKSMANKTRSVQPILTLAEPELSGNFGNEDLEPLAPYDKNDHGKLARSCLIGSCS